jgi:phenylalanine-4-hydroxylase
LEGLKQHQNIVATIEEKYQFGTIFLQINNEANYLQRSDNTHGCMLHIPMNTLPSFTFTCENSSDIMTKNKNVVPKVLPHQDSYMNIKVCM